MNIEQTKLPDVYIIKPQIIKDDRGYFLESYRKDLLNEVGIPVDYVQDNISSSERGTLRGLHYQVSPAEQDKLVQCLVGEIVDIAVDIREDSPTYKKWVSVHLSEKNHYSVAIPKGFAHGFYVLSQTCLISYKCSNLYNKDCEKTIKWNDSSIGIKWPLLPNTPLLLSKKDQSAKPLKINSQSKAQV